MCTSLACKLSFLTLDGRQSQVHSGTCSECPLKLVVSREVMPPRSVTKVRQHFSATACLPLPTLIMEAASPLQCQQPPTKLHGITRIKTQIFIITTWKHHIWHRYQFGIQTSKLYCSTGHATQSSVFHYRGKRGLWRTLYTALGPSGTDCTLLKYITV